jgi:inner membrane transporter RhtA
MSDPANRSSSLVRLTRSWRLTSIGLVIGGVVSVQLGAAVATKLFDEIGPEGTVWLRALFAGLALWAIWRPSLRDARRRGLRDVVLFAVALAAMNLCFYESLDRIPLGIAVTLEFVGPLGVALLSTRRPADLLWAGLAAVGIVLLAPRIGGPLDPAGVALALCAGGFWAAYIVLSARIGRLFSGGDGLAVAMALAALLLLPVGVGGAGADLLDPPVLLAAFGVAMLSSAIPYSVELEALRRLPPGTFGVLMSLEPAVAALIGYLVLGQDLQGAELLAIVLVAVASSGALGTARAVPAPEA